MSFFNIDGSQKSGSGTILRYSTCIASVLKKSLTLYNIRQKRVKQGLRPQHLKALQACQEITKGKLENAFVNSNEIFYQPGKKIHGGNYTFDIQTAGSTTMLCQTIMPLLLFGDKASQVEIIGGLFQDFAPSAYHLINVVFPLLKRMNIDVSLEIIKPGYVPHGQGIIKLKVNPIKGSIKSINLEKQGKIKKIKGIALSSHLENQKVSERMASSFQNELSKFNQTAEIEIKHDITADQKGACLTCFLETDENCLIGMDMSGKLRRTSEFIGKNVAIKLFKDFSSKATVDRYTADQLILYAALANGKTSYYIPKITEHIETNLWLINKMLKSTYTLENNLLTIQGTNFNFQKS